MKGRTILFVDEDEKNTRFCKRILSATRAKVFTTRRIDEALDLLISNRFDLVFADFSCRKILEAASKINRNTKTVMLAQRPLEQLIDYFAKSPFVTSFLAKNPENGKSQIDPMDLLLTTEKILRNDIFGIEKYMKWGIEPTIYQLYDSDRREEYMDKVSEFCKSLGCRESLIKIVISLCDEFLTNALYDAPLAAGVLVPEKRKERVVLAPEHCPTFKFASDGDLLAISVEDPFGAIGRETILAYLNKCFSRGNDQIDSKVGGAGLGLYFIWRSVSQFIINVEPGVRSEFIGIIDLSLTMKEFKKRIKSFHYFSTQYPQ